MNFTKVRNVTNPIRATSHSAGIDFFIPEFDDNFKISFYSKNKDVSIIFKDVMYDHLEYILVGPHKRVLIPSGIHVKVPTGYALIAHNKSGIATRLGLDRLAEVVDEDYQGEVHISVVNTSNNDVRIYAGDKLIQFVLVKVDYSEPYEITALEKLYPEKTKRGEGGFGSTGN